MTKERLTGFEMQDGDADLLPKLTEPHRQILTEAAANGGSVYRVAAAMQLPEGTAKSRLHRARKALIALRPQKVPAA